MRFDVDQNFAIFTDFLKSRPHYKPDALKRDIQNYYLPFIDKLITLRNQRKSQDGLIVGISAVQGAGKTTQGEILEILLRHLDYASCSLSTDDHYVTHEDLTTLRQENAGFIRRGVTHDISLAIEDLTRLKTMKEGKAILVSGYDKGAHHGDGDRFRWVKPSEEGVIVQAQVTPGDVVVDKQTRNVNTLHLISVSYHGKQLELPEHMGVDLPVLEGFLPAKLCAFLADQTDIKIYLSGDKLVFENGNASKRAVPKDTLPKGWRLVTQKPAFIFYDGWMLGAFPVTDESIFDSNLPGLESETARQWAKATNLRLELYRPLWDMINFLTILYVPNYHMSLLWREQAEQALRTNGRGMTSQEIQEFVHYFWRSVHPAIHIKNLAHDTTHTHQVVIIDDDRSIKEVLTPDKASVSYA